MKADALVVGAVPLVFVAIGLASAATGVLDPTGTGGPVGGTLLVLVGLTLLASLWLAGWWHGDAEDSR